MLNYLIKSFIACFPLELSWVIDVSGILDKDKFKFFRMEIDFEEVKSFVKHIQSKIWLGINKTKAAVTTYGNEAHRNLKCKDNRTIESFNEAVDKINPLPGKSSNMLDGLESGLHSLMNDGCGEKNSHRIIILITSGRRNTDREKELYEATKYIQQAGIIIHIVVIVSAPIYLAVSVSTNIYQPFRLSNENFVNSFIKNVMKSYCNNSR